MDKRIILDCDGVLLDWAYAFDVWMVEHGYSKISNTNQYYEQTRRYGISQVEAVSQIKRFNESGCVGFIPAFRDSVEYVTKLSELGWKFEVISCLDKDKYAQKLRQKNYFICLVMFLTLLIVLWTSQLVKSNTYLTDIKERIIIGLRTR